MRPGGEDFAVGYLEDNIDKLVAEKKAKKGKDGIEIDLTSLGIDKVLGGGKVATPMKLTVSAASQKAIEKIESAGGKIDLPEIFEAAEEASEE